MADTGYKGSTRWGYIVIAGILLIVGMNVYYYWSDVVVTRAKMIAYKEATGR